VNLFATVLTYPAPSANYRGESELNRTVIQKVTDGKFDYPIFSPESIRNALREVLRGYGLPSNRERLHDEKQLAVKFNDLPHPEKYVDDFFFGYLVAATDDDRLKYKQQVILNEDDGRGAELRDKVRELVTKLEALKGTKEEEGEGEKKTDNKKAKKQLQDKLNGILEGFAGLVFKRDSVLRMNMAKALEPYRHNAVFTQSPLAAGGSAYQNATTSALLHRETAVSAFQYPFALNIDDCKPKAEWTRKLLTAIGELNDVAGNHARSYFEFAPASIVVRLTKQLVAGYQSYGFRTVDRPGGEEYHLFPEVVSGILHEPTADYPGKEFYIGGKIVKDMTDDQLKKLTDRGVTVNRNPQELLETVATAALGKG
jgi:CRISPR-associated protein Cst2